MSFAFHESWIRLSRAFKWIFTRWRSLALSSQSNCEFANEKYEHIICFSSNLQSEKSPEGNWPSRAATNGILDAVKHDINAVPNTDAATIIGINLSSPGAICDAKVVPTASAFNNPLIPRTYKGLTDFCWRKQQSHRQPFT